MARKPHQIKELVALKTFFGKYTNRITIISRHVASKKLTKALEESGLDYKLTNGFNDKMIYYKNEDHDAMMSTLTVKAKARRIENITRPFNDKAKTEMLGDKHLLIVKNLPFKKFRYRVILKLGYKDSTTDLGFLKSQNEIGTIRLSWSLYRRLSEGNALTWYWRDNFFYVEDEATTSMAALMYSGVIDKIYIYKTYDEMKEEQ